MQTSLVATAATLERLSPSAFFLPSHPCFLRIKDPKKMYIKPTQRVHLWKKQVVGLGESEWEWHSQLMPKPGPSETSGLNVPAWSFKDQPKDQKFPHPSGKTSEKEMGTWQPWIYLPAPPGNSRKKQLLYCSGGCERTRLEVCAHFHVPPALPGDPLSGASLQDSSWKCVCVWGPFF